LLKALADPISAAEWFVKLDGAPTDEVTEARFAAWLDHAAEHDAELRRCEAAAGLVRALADDPELRWAYDEAAALDAAGRRPSPAPPATRLGIAAAVVAASAALLLLLNEAPSGRARPRSPIAADLVAARHPVRRPSCWQGT
jgi:ferric-dicitrate binding protein FerR (iron transport regulator)